MNDERMEKAREMAEAIVIHGDMITKALGEEIELEK